MFPGCPLAATLTLFHGDLFRNARSQREAAELLRGPRARPVPVGFHDHLRGVHTAFLSDLRPKTTGENNNRLSDPLTHSQCSQQLGRACGRQDLEASTGFIAQERSGELTGAPRAAEAFGQVGGLAPTARGRAQLALRRESCFCRNARSLQTTQDDLLGILADKNPFSLFSPPKKEKFSN